MKRNEPVEPVQPEKAAAKPKPRAARKPVAKKTPVRKPARKKPGPSRRRDWQTPFLRALEEIGFIRHACTLANVSDESVRRERARSADFDAKVRAALDTSVEQVEVLLRDFARVGVKKRRINRIYEPCTVCAGKTQRAKLACKACLGTSVSGTIVSDTEIVEQSVTAAIFFLKTNARDKYGDRVSVESGGLGGGPIQIDVHGREADVAVDRFGAEVVRLVDARRARDSAALSSTG